MALSLLGCLGVAPTWAQTKPKILVLTTNEGYAGENFTFKLPSNGTTTSGSFYYSDGKIASDNLAMAFGNGSTLIANAPEVTYLYGALSVRPVKKDALGNVVDNVVTGFTTATPANYSATATATVRVLTANTATGDPKVVGGLTKGETVVYVPDDTKFLDPANLDSIFKPSGGGRYDLIIVGSTYLKVTDEAYAALTKVMQSPELKPNAILYFIDSCCDAATNRSLSYNVQRLTDAVLSPATKIIPADPLNPPMVNGLTTNSGYAYSYSSNMSLNSQTNFTSAPATEVSKYATGFQSQLPRIAGGDYQAIINVPNDNLLYRVQGNSIANNRAYGIFFPAPQIYNGNGACTFAVVDISPFDANHIAANTTGGNNIGQAFVNAALAGGACGGMASISAAPPVSNVDLVQKTASITLTITNKSLAISNSPVTGGRVAATLPDHVKLSSSTAASSTCKDSIGNTITPVISRNADPMVGDGFALSDVTLPINTSDAVGTQANCTVTLPVEWSDTADISTNACIDASKNTATLTIVPGVPNQFSTTQGQTNDIAKAAVVCTAPELALSIPTAIASSYAAGAMVSYDVKVENLSQTAAAPALGAVLSGLAPAGITLTTIEEKSAASMLKAGPVACTSADNCPLPADIPTGGSSTFTVSFVVPANSPTMAWTPTVTLAIPASEVTTTNNSVQLASTTQSALTVQAQLNGPGIDSSSALNNAGMAYNVSGCTATPASGSAPLGINAAGAAQPSTMPSGTPCVVAFTGAPDASQLPTGYGITGPVITTSAPDATTGNQTSVAVWTALPPGLAAITGSIVGGPTPFPASLVGKTLNYTLTCQASPAQQPSGKLTIGASGQLTTTDNLTVPGGSTCTLTVDGLAQLPTAPSDYRWSSASAAPGGAANSFVVTLTLRSDRAIGDPTPVPTLGQWALYLLSTMMLMAAALRLRKRRV